MDCNEDTGREMMKRTIALLLSFAAMAEGVATRSYFVRCFMLWILRRAETSAQRYVTGADASPSAQPILQRNSPAEAVRLAKTFRELANALKDELRQDQHFVSWWGGRKARMARLTSPFEGGGRTAGPGGGEFAPLRQVLSVTRTLHSLAVERKTCHVFAPP